MAVHIPWFGNQGNKVEGSDRDATIINSNTIEYTIPEALNSVFSLFLNDMNNNKHWYQHIVKVISSLQESIKHDKLSDWENKKAISMIEVKKQELVRNVSELSSWDDFSNIITSYFPWTKLKDYIIRIIASLEKETNKESILFCLGYKTVSWEDTCKFTTESLEKYLWETEPVTITWHSQWGLIIACSIPSIAVNLIKNINEVILYAPVLDATWVQSFQKWFDDTYLHPWRDLVVTKEYIESLAGIKLSILDLARWCKDNSISLTIELGEKDPYLSSVYTKDIIEKLKEKWVEIRIHKNADHYIRQV